MSSISYWNANDQCHLTWFPFFWVNITRKIVKNIRKIEIQNNKLWPIYYESVWNVLRKYKYLVAVL